MKKLKLNLQNIEGVELLTREQLKKALGGDGSGNELPSIYYTCRNGSYGSCPAGTCCHKDLVGFSYCI